MPNRRPTVLLASLIAGLFAALLPCPPALAQTSLVAFESGPVRPIALSPNGARLFVVNTPDNRLEIYRVEENGLKHIDSVPVGVEPVAVAARSDSEIWVVNHLSDSVSVVYAPDIKGAKGRVVRTLLVGDEPRDIVFAGSGGSRAFITTAHRGQHRTHTSISGVPGAGDPQLTTPGISRADVWVFDATAPGNTLGGTPLRIIELFTDTPRALAVSADGNTVYAAGFHTGNKTAVVSEGMVCDGFGVSPCNGDGVTSPNGLAGGQLPGGNPGPAQNGAAQDAPEVGLIVQFDDASGEWRDELGRNWSNGVRFHLPDLDVFAIDAGTLTQTDDFAGVGTILFNMAVNPANGNLYVSNTDAQNLTRFEGPGIMHSTVQGNLAQSHITVITPGGAVKPRHLNRHIDYSVRPAPAGVRDHSLATPVEMAVTSDGARLYVAAFGSSKVGVIDTADLDNDALWDGAGAEFDPTVESANYIPVSGGGPAGLVLDEANDRLYVATRFDNGVSVVDTTTGTEISHLVFYNPEPDSISAGRPMLYDAFKTSSNGEASCSSCHIFGDFDSLAWDLGVPEEANTFNPQPINLGFASGSDINGTGTVTDFASMKGPMTTQTLRGMVTSGHMHWRGDRANGFFGIDNPHTNDSELSFKNFIVAFEGLVGSEKPPTDPGLQADMQDFADFMLQVMLPPNPVRALDNSLNSDEQNGFDFFNGTRCSDGICFGQPDQGTGFRCEGCHDLDASLGFFGTGGNASFENETQILKVPHLRNMYQKVGMFGSPNLPFFNPGNNAHQGDQVRGTGFLHDGSTDTLFRFFQATVFNNNSGSGFDGGDPQRRDMEAYMMAFDTDLAPIVGQQITLDSGNAGTVGVRIDLLEERAEAAFTSAVLGGNVKECDLVAHALVSGVQRGWLYDPSLPTPAYVSDWITEPALSSAALRALAGTVGQEVTFTCAPPGSGVRMALDRDEDGVYNFDEILGKTSGKNPASFPGACSNGQDDDGDGLSDLADPGCKDASWDIENPACNDGLDNDADGQIDLADDRCSSAWATREGKVGCGLGFEAGLFILGVWALRRPRAARRHVDPA